MMIGLIGNAAQSVACRRHPSRHESVGRARLTPTVCRSARCPPPLTRSAAARRSPIVDLSPPIDIPPLPTSTTLMNCFSTRQQATPSSLPAVCRPATPGSRYRSRMPRREYIAADRICFRHATRCTRHVCAIY